MRNNSQRHTLTQVRQKHSEHHGKHSKAARSLQNALAVRNAKSVQGGRNSRQEEEDDEAFTTMEQAMSSAFDELGFKSAFHALQQLENEQDTDDVQEPDMDIHETDFSYVVQADLPGVKKGDLSVSIEDGILTVEGQRQNMFEHRRKGVHVVERNTGSFSRSVELPDNIIEDEVEASMENGVLTVEVFKNDPAWNGDADHLEDDDEEEEGDEEEEDVEDEDEEEEDDGEQMVLLEEELEDDDDQLDSDQDEDDEDAPILIIMQDDDDEDDDDEDEDEDEQDDHRDFSQDGQIRSNRVKVVYM